MTVNIKAAKDSRIGIGRTISWNRIEYSNNGNYQFVKLNKMVFHYETKDFPEQSIPVYDPAVNRMSRRPNIIGYIVPAPKDEYYLVNDQYGICDDAVTIDELQTMLQSVFGDFKTELKEIPGDGIYESETGILVAECR